jgi:hypothetical protein
MRRPANAAKVIPRQADTMCRKHFKVFPVLRGKSKMSISSISPEVATSVAVPVASKSQASPAQQAGKPVVPPAVSAAADSDGDHDGSSSWRIDVRA